MASKLTLKEAFDFDPLDHTPEQMAACKAHLAEVVAKLRAARGLKAVADARAQVDAAAKRVRRKKNAEAKEFSLDDPAA